MIENQTLELQWVERRGRAHRQPYLSFTMAADSPEERVSYFAGFQVCPTPTCACHTLAVGCQKSSPGGSDDSEPLPLFWVDLRKRSVAMTPELEADRKTLGLAQWIEANLADADWVKLEDWFWTAKLEVIQTADLTKVDLTDLPNADGGLMVPFVEVFPLGLSLYFEFENAFWAADEQYCVQPGCQCTNTVLSFFQLKDASGKVTGSRRNSLALRYDFKSHSAKEVVGPQPGMPSAGKLLAALKAACPGLDKQLKLHQTILQGLYRRHYAEQETARPLPPPVTSNKIERNAPCPCGSGKKYKKCCGA